MMVGGWFWLAARDPALLARPRVFPVMLRLAEQLDHEDYRWIDQQGLADAMGVRLSTISDLLGVLRRAGYLARRRRGALRLWRLRTPDPLLRPPPSSAAA